GEEEVGRRDAAPLVAARLVDLAELRVAERLDRLDAALGEVARDALDEHAPQPAVGERLDDVGRHQQYRLRGAGGRRQHREPGNVGNAIERGTYAGGANITNPAGMPST